MRKLGKDAKLVGASAVMTLESLSHAAGIPILRELTEVGLKVIGFCEKVKVYQAECRRLAEYVESITTAIVQATVDRSAAELGEALDRDLWDLIREIDGIASFMDELGARRGLGRLTSMFDSHAANTLRDHELRLSAALERFKIQSSIRLRACVEAPLGTGTEQRLVLSSAGGTSVVPVAHRLPYLPPRPKVFFGRDEVVETIVQTIVKEPQSSLCILGPGGIGKTAVASIVIYDERVVTRFAQQRYFIRCDRAETAAGIVSSLAEELGVGDRVRTARDVVYCLESRIQLFPCLLVLDNLETAWDSVQPNERQDVEEILAYLAELPTIALLVTMRGAERPETLSVRS